MRSIISSAKRISSEAVASQPGCYETEYWLELFVKTNIIPESQYNTLKNNCGKIRKLLIASINTAKANQ